MHLQDNLGSTRLEVERLRASLIGMYGICKVTVDELRQRLHMIATDSVSDRAAVTSQFKKIAEVCDRMKNEALNREREVINRLTVDHELELNDIKKCLNVKDETIDTLKQDKCNADAAYAILFEEREQERVKYEQSLAELNGRMVELEKLAATAAADKQKAVNEIKEKMMRDHKTELESLRSRFKLMTNMERSPSDTSLEKIERPDYLDIGAPLDLIHIQMPAYPRLSSLGACSPRSPTKSSDMFRHILEDKEQQLDALRNREQMLNAENMRYKETIQKLAESEHNEKEVAMLRQQLEALQANKTNLELQLVTEKTKRLEMESSVAVDKRYFYFYFFKVDLT